MARNFGIAAGRPYTINGRNGAKARALPAPLRGLTAAEPLGQTQPLARGNQAAGVAHQQPSVSVDFTVLLFCLGVVLGYVLKAFAG